MPVVFKKLGTVFIVLAVVTLAPAKVLAIDLGLTPAQVYSLWTGINESLAVIARVVSDDAAWHREFSAIRPRAVRDKNPADVLGQLDAYRAKLDRLRRMAGLRPIRRFVGDGTPVTPTVVYLNSGLVLNGQVEWLIANTGPEQLVSQFYRYRENAGRGERTPSQVYALVELANRGLARILAVAGIPDHDVASRDVAP